MDVKFHCDVDKTFKEKGLPIRSFIYTEYSIPLHSHDFYEMNIVFRGKGTHKIENSCFSVKSGDVFVIPPMIAHAYYDTEGLDVYHLLFTKEFLCEIAEEASSVPGFLSLVEIEPYLRRHCQDTMFLHLTASKLMQIKNDVLSIEDGNEYDLPELLSLKKHGVLQLLYKLSYCLHSQLKAQMKSSGGKYDTAIISALEYIHLNYQNKITVEMLCRLTFLSRSTFLRSFYSICGCSPAEYLRRYRIGKSLELAASGAYSKTEIAYKCGFYDLSHMERMLKKQ